MKITITVKDEERVRVDIAGAVQILRQHAATPPLGSRGKLALVEW